MLEKPNLPEEKTIFDLLSPKCSPTMRAADDGWAARFLSVFAALSLFRFVSESQLQPIAANASR
jgi:hypothetical protein